MEETIVYLPVSRNASGMFPDVLVFSADEVVAALDAAGVKWTHESPEELKIRMMKLQIEELKKVCTDLQSQLKAARDCNLTLETKLRRFEGLEEKHTELQDQNAALKMTAQRAQEELKSVALTNGWREV